MKRKATPVDKRKLITIIQKTLNKIKWLNFGKFYQRIFENSFEKFFRFYGTYQNFLKNGFVLKFLSNLFVLFVFFEL